MMQVSTTRAFLSASVCTVPPGLSILAYHSRISYNNLSNSAKQHGKVYCNDKASTKVVLSSLPSVASSFKVWIPALTVKLEVV